MHRATQLLKRHPAVAVLLAITLILTTIPLLDAYLVLGDQLPTIAPTFTDETFYYARVQMIVEGHSGGNPYFYEHRDDPPLVVFAGLWLNALPQLSGLSLNASLVLNMVIWSILFAIALYWLLRELRVPPWLTVVSAIVTYLESYGHMWRAANLQTVYPFYFLFYGALFRLIKEQNRKNIILLGLAIGAGFYMFAYLWQIAVITLVLLVLYAFIRRQWQLTKAALFSSLIGGVIGLPVPLYMLWLSHSSPYFWESFRRLGLVDTHLPMAEIIYSGGWIGVVLALLAILLWRVRALRQDGEFTPLTTFLFVSGLGLWVMQGSNLITGRLLETGEHVKIMILPWLIFATVSVAVALWRRRTLLSNGLQILSVALLTILIGANVYLTNYYFSQFFLPQNLDRGLWQTQQLYAGPFTWLQEHEREPVVVWSNPAHYLATNLPIFTRHFDLYTYFGMLELAPEGEIRERYLISQYFDNPTAAYLEDSANMSLYLGRADFPHRAKTIERGIKICRILFFWDTGKDCGTPPTPQDLLGKEFFADLAQRFQTDIKPNIKTYLAKYRVSYILKDMLLDSQYRPEKLQATRVYADDRYELWEL